MSNLAVRAYNSITRLGVKRTLQTVLSVAEDTLFDWRLGTDTTTRVPQAKLKVIAPNNQAQARPYFMTRARALRRAFEHAHIPLDQRFLDIGCGKGKALITAILFGYKDVLGIEFAPDLVKAAQANLGLIASHLPPDAKADVICADATSYEFEAKDAVFFLFNPFGTDVMRGFCQQVAKSLKTDPRPIWLIYADADCIDVVLEELPVKETSRLAYGGFEFVFLGNTADATFTSNQPSSQLAAA